MSPPKFPSGLTLAEARAALVGVEVVAAMGCADHLPSLHLAGPYRVLNITAEALIVGPVVQETPDKLNYGPPDPNNPAHWRARTDRKSSILFATGQERHKFAGDVFLWLHPVNVRALCALLGLPVPVRLDMPAADLHTHNNRKNPRDQEQQSSPNPLRGRHHRCDPRRLFQGCSYRSPPLQLAWLQALWQGHGDVSLPASRR